MKMKIMVRLFGIVLLSTLVACGGGEAEKKDEKKSPISIGTNVVEEVEEDNGITEIVLESSDEMKFNKKKLVTKEGNQVKLTLKHVGKMGKEVMGHNFVLLAQGTDIMAFGEKAVEAADNNYIPEGSEKVIVYTEMIGGGESTTITFDAPAKGEYDFICSFPGHVALMKGKFVVE